MRLTILASILSGLAAGLLGALIVVLVIDDDDSAPAVADSEAQAELQAEPDQAAEAATTGSDDGGVVAAVDRIRRSIVLITVELTDRVDDEGRSVPRGGIGTGVVLDDAGHIITNEHVVRDAVRIELKLHDGTTRTAETIGSDAPFTDFAVLRTDPTGLPPAAFKSSSGLRLGDSVMAFGNALGNDAAVTRGIVSNPHARFIDREGVRQDYIQTDTAVNPGNSGGPLIDAEGAVVGLVSRVVTSTVDGQTVQGIGFALATDRVLPLAERIIELGDDYPRPDFGVVDQSNLNEFFAEQLEVSVTSGAFLLEILRVGVLAEAGLRPGDVILSLNGFEITEDAPYHHVLLELEPGSPVDVVYLDQQGEERLVEVTPSRRNR